MKKILLSAITVYQRTAAIFFGGQCRFYPSCSHYFKTALEKYRIGKAIYLGLRRILRCHPWNPGGIDPA